MENKVAALVGELSRVLVQKDVVSIITGYLLRSSAEKMYDWIETLPICSREQHRKTVERYRSDCHICCSDGLRYIDDPVLERVFFRKDEGGRYGWWPKDIYRHIYADYWHSVDSLVYAGGCADELAWRAKGGSSKRADGLAAVIQAVLDDW